jgi:hypothetical protein
MHGLFEEEELAELAAAERGASDGRPVKA